MRPVRVVVSEEDAEHVLEVAAVQDQEPVEALSAGSADEALGDRVRLRCAHRGLDDLDAFACEDRIEAARELGVAVADQEAKTRWLLLEPPGELTSLLGDPGASRFGGAASEMDAATAHFDEEENIEALKRDCLDVKKSTASMLCACCRKNARHDRPER